jgi:hypothetical protein
MAPKPHQVHRFVTVKLEDHVSRKEKKCRGLTMFWVQMECVRLWREAFFKLFWIKCLS